MTKKPSEENNPGHVTRAECYRTTTIMKEDLKTIRTALVGKDMRGGIVKDVTDLKKDVGDLKKTRSATVDTIRSVVVSIVVAVVTAWIIMGMPL